LIEGGVLYNLLLKPPGVEMHDQAKNPEGSFRKREK
jgi:hypothetical protein